MSLFLLLWSEITTLPCFDEVEATPECTFLWERRYHEYLRKSTELFKLDKEEKNDEFQKLYQSYKHVSILYVCNHKQNKEMSISYHDQSIN